MSKRTIDELMEALDSCPAPVADGIRYHVQINDREGAIRDISYRIKDKQDCGRLFDHLRAEWTPKSMRLVTLPKSAWKTQIKPYRMRGGFEQDVPRYLVRVCNKLFITQAVFDPESRPRNERYKYLILGYIKGLDKSQLPISPKTLYAKLEKDEVEEYKSRAAVVALANDHLIEITPDRLIKLPDEERKLPKPEGELYFMDEKMHHYELDQIDDVVEIVLEK
jgi:hypothetical protein